MNTHNRQSRPTVVCLHSSMSHGGQWRALASRLAADFTVITPNLLGYDGAGDPFAAPLCLDDEVNAVVEQLKNVAGPIHLVGHSFGGAVALRLATLYPEQIASLTVYEPVWFALLFEEAREHVELPELRRIAKLLASASPFGQTRGAQDFINYWANGDAWSGLPAEQQHRLTRLSAKVAAEFGALTAVGPATQELACLKIPVRLLCGTNTTGAARRISELLAELVPGVEYQRLQGLAHMAPVTHADDVNPLIVDHILAHEGAAVAAVA